MQIGEFEFRCTNKSDPETYTVYDEDKNMVGYVRLRFGVLYAQAMWGAGDIVYCTKVDKVDKSFGGSFVDDKARRIFLSRIAERLRRYNFIAKCPLCGCHNHLGIDDLEDLDEVGKVVLNCVLCNKLILVEDDGDGLFVRTTVR